MCASTFAGVQATRNAFVAYSTELVALAPDLILAASGTAVPPLLRATRSVPIVFVQAADPVGNGYVASLARPGGNATGFTNIEYGMGAKWLEILKQIVPAVTRAAVLRDATDPTGIGQWAGLQSVATSFAIELTPIGVHDANEIVDGVAAFARAPNSALIVTASAPTAVHRELIVGLAARHRLPAVYAYRYHVTSGGLISYGPDTIDPYRRAAGYVDRILKGEKPADLPVQAADQVRAGHQPQDRQGARPRSAAHAARPRRRGDRMIAARVHHAARRRGGAWPLAARAQQPSACGASACFCPRQRTIRNTRPGSERSCRRWRYWAGPSAATCGSTPAGPTSQCRRHSQTRSRIGRARAGRHSCPWRLDRGAAATGDPHRSDRVPGPRRSGRRRLCRQPGAARRQRHRFHDVRIQHEREMAGAAQRDRAKRETGGGPSGFRR